MKEKMSTFSKKYGNSIIAVSSIFLITILTGVLITATGKILVLEYDGLAEGLSDLDENSEGRRFDGGRIKVYVE